MSSNFARTIARKSGAVGMFERLFLPTSIEKRINGQDVDFTLNSLFYYLKYDANPAEDWWVEDISQRFCALVSEGDTVYDIGANHGYYTLLAATEAGSRGSVIAFEPMEKNCLALSRNIAYNALPGTQTVAPVALGTDSGTVPITTNRPRLSEGEDDTVEVRMRTADSFRSHGTAPDLVKIDVEGGEAAVLEGMERILSDDHPTLIVEVHEPEVIRQIGGSREGIYQTLLDHGYELDRVEIGGGAESCVTGPPEHDEIHFLVAT